MSKKTVCSLTLLAALVLCVQSGLAQNYLSLPAKQSIQQYGPFTNTVTKSTVKTAPVVAGKCGNPAGPCLFYGGDFVDNVLGPPSLPNGLSNETTTFIPGTPYGSATWVPFTVPAGQTWTVTGLFTNDQSSYGVLDQTPNTPTAAAFWEIQEGTLAGQAGTIIASGTAAATSTATGRSAFGLYEYTVQVEGLSITLTPGTYFMAVVPICTNAGNPYCDGRFFLSDVEYVNTKPTHVVGTEPQDASFFDSSFFGETYDPTNGSLGALFGEGGDAFSAGVLGTK
jgi:hypothetical protein